MLKEIKTERLSIKPFNKTDFKPLAELLTNEQIKKTFIIPDFTTKEALSKTVVKLYATSLSDEQFMRGIFLKDELIGFVNDVEVCDNAIEIGYLIHPKHQNKGYATEMFRAVIKALLDDGYSAVTAGAFEQNGASIRVMQKCGMTKIDKEEDIEYRGKTMHCVYYSTPEKK